MTTTITRGSTVFTLTGSESVGLMGYRSERATGNIVHPIIGRGNPDITFGPAGLRTGTLRMMCASKTDALTLSNLLAGTGTFVLTDTDSPQINMTFVPSGKLSTEVDSQGWKRWIVECDFQEVTL